MEAFKVSKDSWHYKVVLFGSNSSKYNVPRDICGYTKKLLITLFVVLVVCCLILLAISAYCVSGYLFIHWWYFLEAGKMPVEASFFLGITSVILLAGTIIGGIVLFPKLIVLDRDIKAPSFIRTAYASFKDKFCVKLDFIDKR